jgi:YVTN family beta-propeller protein
MGFQFVGGCGDAVSSRRHGFMTAVVVRVVCATGVLWALAWGSRAQVRAATPSFVNWETAPVHPIALSPGGGLLALANLPDNRVELFDVTSGQPVPDGAVPVGLDPVSVRFRTEDELWVVNHISDSVSIVDLSARQVVATLDTADGPADLVFAGTPERAFVSCSGANSLQVFDPATRLLVTSVALEGERPRALAVSPDGRQVVAAFFESGNRTTILSGGVSVGTPRPTVVDFPQGPHGGVNPPPNQGTNFVPGLNPGLPANMLPPKVGLIVRKNDAGRWLDDTDADWTEYVSGTNSVFSGRPAGWDVLDHDLAVVDTETLEVRYLTGLMNLCMTTAIQPVSGRIAVAGTEAMNHIRFEPVLRGTFVRVQLALVAADGTQRVVRDLNPHLDYQHSEIAEAERRKSIGDPRGMLWNPDGTRLYVTGMGSDNVLILDADGARLGEVRDPRLGAGPTGMALDASRQLLYLYSRFSATLAVIDLGTETVTASVPLFDPTPDEIRKGRPHLYNTHATSGLGQVSCASCHVDARFDRLAWDLGDPRAGLKLITRSNVNFARFPPAQTNHFHPMKGPMMTQTLQDIIGHEPFHWRGDRDGLEGFNGTFTNLQGRGSLLTTNEMTELKDFLGSIHYPPNPHRRFNNSLSTKLALPGHRALGRGALPAGQPLPAGNAQAGLLRFRLQGTDGCIHCHTLPTGLGPDMTFTALRWIGFPVGPQGEHHSALIALSRSSDLPFKISQLRNLADKTGFNLDTNRSRAGFGFLHDGSVDSLARFVQDGFDFRDDQETADMVAFMLSLTGSDLPPGSFTDTDRPPGLAGKDVPAGVGRQITIQDPATNGMVTAMIQLATSPTARVDLVVRGMVAGTHRGWVFDRLFQRFDSDRNTEIIAADSLRALAGDLNPLTYSLVPRGSGVRIGVDRDEDGYFDLTEIEFGSDPTNPLSLATNRPPMVAHIVDQVAAAGSPLELTVSATDPDLPPQRLTFMLDPPVPAGASIDPATGRFTWTPTQPQALQTHAIAVGVTDDGSPGRKETATFTVTVLQHPLAPRLENIEATASGLAMTWVSRAGSTYQIQFKSSLADPVWQALGPVLEGTGEAISATLPIDDQQHEAYFRILLLD